MQIVEKFEACLECVEYVNLLFPTADFMKSKYRSSTSDENLAYG